MQKTLCLYKPVGETPLQTILKFKAANTIYQEQILSFAGRLDPMADGILLVLVGEENKKRRAYESLEKSYDFSVLFGISTDSYDLLGLPTITRPSCLDETLINKLQTHIHTLAGKHEQMYPPFSSKTISGKPLYYWARENKLSEVAIPSKTITISSLKQHKQSQIKIEELMEKIKHLLPLVNGEFRQEKILTAWDKLFAENTTATFSLLTFSITCSSGTYVRSIAHQMGEYLETGALAYSIKRTRIGTFTLDHAIDI